MSGPRIPSPRTQRKQKQERQTKLIAGGITAVVFGGGLIALIIWAVVQSASDARELADCQRGYELARAQWRTDSGRGYFLPRTADVEADDCDRWSDGTVTAYLTYILRDPPSGADYRRTLRRWEYVPDTDTLDLETVGVADCRRIIGRTRFTEEGDLEGWDESVDCDEIE